VTATDEHQRLQELLIRTADGAGSASADLSDGRGYRRLASRRRLRQLAGIGAAAVLIGVALTPIMFRGGPILAAGTAANPTHTQAAAETPPTSPVYSNASTPTIAEIRVSYRYNLLTACGVRYLRFADQVWVADHPLGGPASNPPSGWPSPYALGTIRLTSRTELVFSLPPHPPVAFHAVPDPMPMCA
jgi:hypothetical protein